MSTEHLPAPAPDDRGDQPPAASMPPPARREELVEELHGHRVADPYRWLEAPASDPEVAAFIDAQDAAARGHLAALPARDLLHDRLRQVWNHPRRSVPWRRGGRWFQLRNDGLQDQDVLWTAVAHSVETHDDEPHDDDPEKLPGEHAWTITVDPNDWSADGTRALSGLSVTDDGRRLALGRSEAGSDWTTWTVVDLDDPEATFEEVPWSKFSRAAWLPDGSGFVYGAFDPPAEGEEHAAANRGQQLRLHRLGTPAADDQLLHADPADPERGFHPEFSHDGRWLVVSVTRGTDPETGVLLAPVDEAASIGELRTLLDGDRAQHRPIGVLGGELLVISDLDAARGRIIAVDLEEGSITERVAESETRLIDAHLVGAAAPDEPGWLVLHHLVHATSRLTVVDPSSGDELGRLPLPWPVTVGGLAGGRDDHTLHLDVASFTAPDRLLACHLPDLEVADTWQPAVASDDAAELVVEQVGVRHDDVTVPLFLVHRADVTPDGERPTVLWGYGGFDIPVTPMHRPGWRAWVQSGGVLAVACLRGGGEYGQEWHDAGRRAAKEHVFDDALACAAWLTGRRGDEVAGQTLGAVGDPGAVWTRPEQLGIEGRSNGGLLVGACLTREPEAFGSAVPEVGVLDLVRFHLFTIGWAWTSDFGSPDDPEDLEVILRYSPYHNLVAGRSYPPTLITTGDTDDRVVPAHSFKFAAALQAAQVRDEDGRAPAPVLLRVDRSAGHGVGKPVSKLLEERADVLAFHAAHLGLTPTEVGGPA